MRNWRLFVLFLIIVPSIAKGQTYTNIANQQNVNVYLQTLDGWAVGMSFYDFNEDGWDDLSYPMHNDSVKFFINNNGVFSQIPSFINSIGNMKHLLWVDYDNDDDLDIFTTYHDYGIRMYQNNGAFEFTDVTSTIGLTLDAMFSYGAAFADYDKDGFLDLYISNYESLAFNPGVPHHNLLYHNNGDGTFTDVTMSAGVGNGFQTTFCGVWIDINNDSWLDLHVINDRFTTLNALYMNNGDGTFTDQAAAANLTMPLANPMSNSFSDFDNDNDYDLFVTNTSGATLQDDSYNFMVNQGNGQFVDLLNQYGIDSTHWGWGALWIDYNNDSYEDLYITTGELSPVPVPEFDSWFYKNNQGTSFSFWNDSINFSTSGKSFCPVKGDINNDGFYDMAVQNESPTNTFLMLNSGNDNNYIKLKLNATISNSQAIGAEVQVYTNGIKQMHTVVCGDGLCGQNSQYLIFGVGQATLIDSIKATFPSGVIDVKYDVSVNQLVEMNEAVTIFLDIFQDDTLYLCDYNSLQIGVNGYFSYDWNVGDTTPLVNVLSTGNYAFSALDSIGNIIISDTLTVVINPMVDFVPSIINDYCELGIASISLIPLSSYIVEYTINWSNGVEGVLNDSISVGWYSYTFSDSLQCSYTSDSLFIDNQLGHSTAILTQPQTDLQYGALDAYSFGGTPPYIYTLNNSLITLPIDSLSAGDYDLVISDMNGCLDSVEFEILDQRIGLGLTSYSPDKLNYWYSENSLFIQLVQPSELLNVQVSNLSGKVVFNDKIDGNEHQIQIPLFLEPGKYQVLFVTATDSVSGSIVIF